MMSIRNTDRAYVELNAQNSYLAHHSILDQEHLDEDEADLPVYDKDFPEEETLFVANKQKTELLSRSEAF